VPPVKHDSLAPSGDATPADAVPADGSTFVRLGLDARLVATLSALGYEEPTDVQRVTIARPTSRVIGSGEAGQATAPSRSARMMIAHGS